MQVGRKLRNGEREEERGYNTTKMCSVHGPDPRVNAVIMCYKHALIKKLKIRKILKS